MNEIQGLENKNIENMIYEIRGKQVMLDRDLSVLYRVETRILNQKVKRNIERFPENFYFKLTKQEWKNLKSQIVISNIETKENYGGDRYLPNVFTEQGVAMLSAILKSDVAVKVSIDIMDAFVLMRKYISINNYENRISNLETKYIEHDTKINRIFTALESKKKVNEIYFNGQIYDAYSKILNIIKEADEELIIIDNYADITVLDMISKINIPVILITTKNNYLTKIDIEKYNSQYNNLKMIYNNTFHDRYLILDNEIIYHMGSSINHAGSKTFSINKLEDTIVIASLIKEIKKVSN